jgi:single-strand DNA-binding protein
MIQASIYGRLGKDPKPGTTQAGKPMCTASVAVDVGREPGDETLWCTVMAFGHQAEALQRHTKGDMIAAMGRLSRSRYTGTDGQERESWTLLADALHSSRTVRPSARAHGGTGKARPQREHVGAPFDDPLRF